MKQMLVVVAVFLLTGSAVAETYSWSDNSGTLHFTDDLGAVPKKYRNQAIRRATGNEQPTASSETVQETAPVVTPGEATPQVSPGAVTLPTTRFGDRTVAEWQEQFKGLRTELAAIQQQQKELQQEAGEGKKFLKSQQINEMNTRSKQLYEQYEAARQRFNQLAEQANRVGLPPEYAK